MNDKEYKEISIKEFTKAASVYETDQAGVYKMCKKDYPDVLAELEKDGKVFIIRPDAPLGIRRTERDKEKMQFIDIPINLKYTLGLGSMAGIYFATGPQFSFNVGDKKLFDSETYKMKSSNFSWNVGAGVKLINVDRNVSVASMALRRFITMERRNY